MSTSQGGWSGQGPSPRALPVAYSDGRRPLLRSTIITGVVVGALCTGLFAIGAVTDATLGLTTAAVVIAAFWSARTGVASEGNATRLARTALWGASCLAAIQLVPVPASILRVISPRAFERWSALDGLLGVPVHAHSITLDAPATAFCAVTLATIALFFDVCVRYCIDSLRRERLLRAVALVVVAFDSISVLQGLAGIGRIYGIYTPTSTNLSTELVIITPLINPNHAAAVAAAGVPLLIVLALESKATAQKVLWATGAMLSGAVTILTLSRGGMLTLAVETLGLAGLLARQRTGWRKRAGAALLLLAIAAFGILAAVYASKEQVLREATNGDTSKLNIALLGLELGRDFFWTGAGAGAFTSVFSGYEVGLPGMSRFTHAESWPAQIIADFGVPCAVLLTLLLVAGIARGGRYAIRRRLHVGAFVAVLGLVVHDLFDFSLYFAGVGMLGAALLAIVVTCDAPRRSTRDSASTVTAEDEEARVTATARERQILAGAVALAAIPALALHFRHDVEDEARHLADRWLAGDLLESEPQIDAAMRRHPAEPYFVTMGAVRLMAMHADPTPWMLHALHLGPSSAMTHFWIARYFIATERDAQAWGEYREALRDGPVLGSAILNDMVESFAPADEMLSVLNTEALFDQASIELSAIGRESDALVIDQAALERFPPARQTRDRMIHRALAMDDDDRARRLARELVAAVPDKPDGYLALASMIRDPVSAEHAIELGLHAVPDDPAMLVELVERRGRRLGAEAVAPLLDSLRASLMRRDGAAYEVNAVLGSIAEGRRRYGDALRYYEDAASGSPEGTAHLIDAARVAEIMGEPGRAVGYWAHLAALHPEDPHAAAEVARLQTTMHAQQQSIDPSLLAPAP